MDIGVPFRDLGAIDIGAAGAHVAGLPAGIWTANSFRQDVLAAGVHEATLSVLFRHEWQRLNNPWRLGTMEELIALWGREKHIDPTPYLPIAREETDIGPVYTFREWEEHRAVLGPLVERAIAKLRTPTGIVTRLALVLLPPGRTIGAHTDDQVMAHKAHRLHVPLTSTPGVEYKIGGKKFQMKLGHVYDFNNRWRHSVRHTGKLPRVNLFIDYYANPGVYVPPAYGYH